MFLTQIVNLLLKDELKMKMRRSLKRLIDYYNFSKNTNRVSSSRYSSVSSCYKFRNSTPILQQLSRCIHIHIGGGENPKSISYKVEEANAGFDSDPAILKASCTKKKVEEEELTSIKKGDIVNLYDLIFTKNRDYLIRCSDGQRVKSQQLAGKVIVIYLMDMKHISMFVRRDIMYLMDIHNELQSHNCFEVVFVDVSLSGEISPAPSLRKDASKQFKDIFSSMPWTTIPLSDITSREYVKQRFGLQGEYCGCAFVIDPTGIVLQSEASTIFKKFGALGYPFSDERINYLKSEDYKVAMHPSLKALLASPQRDYLISNKGDKVPIHTLEDKVVALYFYEEGFTDKNITVELKKAYKKLAKNNKFFEVVLIYLYNGPNTPLYETNEDSFWKTFKTMPWLALPFRDSIYKKLDRIFHYPWAYNDEPEYSLIIIGPHMGFIEPFGIFILMNFKIPAFPFSREKVAKLLAEEAKELKLEMLWDPESVFGEKYGFEVQYSQLVGKRVIIIFESFCGRDDDRDFLETLKEKYNQLKGTTDEFEVIHIVESYNNESKVYNVANLPWFVQPAGEQLIYKSNMFNFYLHHVHYRGHCALIAFDRDGRVVRRTIFPTVEDLDFPFYDGDLEKEALYQLVCALGWDRLHYIHPGRIYSYKKSYDEVFKYYDAEGLHYPEYEHLRNM